MSKTDSKEKKSFGKKLFRRGSVRSVGSFMSRVLKTLSTLSHFGTEEHATDDEKDDGGFKSFRSTGGRSSARSDLSGAPETFLSCFGDRVPGVAGLKNHGNTCFMNAILQCLSNTELLAEYLALEQFKDSDDDQMKSNGVFIPKTPQQEKGEVTEQLANLVRALWTLEYTPQHSREFKNSVAKNALQYRGSSQQDAQEFLLWLLDRVHEDLNLHRPLLRPPVEEDLTSEGPAFPICTSFVQELFQAQYRSSLTCPHCKKQSNTFDPFLCISLPIPLPHTRPLYVTVVYEGKCSSCMRFGVSVPLAGTVARLREAVCLETKIPTSQIVLTEMYYDGFHRSFCDSDDLDMIHESDSIFAFETPEIFRPEGILTQRGRHANLNQNNLKYGAEHYLTSNGQGAGKFELLSSRTMASDKIVLLVCNRAYSGQQGRRFGHPLVLYLEKTVTWDILQREILEKMKYFLKPGVYIQVAPFSLRVVGVVGITYLLPQVEQPLCHPTVERALKSCGQGGPPHVKIIVEWDRETKEYLFGSIEEEYIPDSESVRQLKELHSQPQSCTLAQCFHLYTKEEQLAPGDAWRCPHCKQLQQGSIKLSLWTLPDVLILHLKRFRQVNDRRIKLQNLVKFPLTGLDMTPHVVKRSQSSWSLPSHWSPWRRPYGMGRDPEDYLYDLYAVCNHHGTMQGGHYTAFCKNSVNGQWYCFDDSDVQPVSDEEVCREMAYILFYQRRSAIPSWSANSSAAGSTSSSLCEHWINRLPGSKPPSIASAASSRRTSLASLSESVECFGERSEDDGGFSTRPFVRSVQRQSLSGRSSTASPLTVSENGVKLSWSLTAKLQRHSSSPSNVSLESPVHASVSALGKIGELCDDKTSTSCFRSLKTQVSGYIEHADISKHESRSAGRAPLAVMEGAFRDENSPNRLSLSLDEKFTKGTAQSDRNDSLDNNNQASSVDQIDFIDMSATKDAPVQKVDNTENKISCSKLSCEEEKTSSRKVHNILPVQQSSASETSSTPQRKSSQKIFNSKEKTELSKVNSQRPSPANAQLKKEAFRNHIGVSSIASQNKQKVASTSQPSSSSVTRNGCSTALQSSVSSAGKSKISDRSLSKQTSKLNSPESQEIAKNLTPTRTCRVKPGDSKRVENRQVRSSSSSSSMTSLRSPSITAKPEMKRDSKAEDKGLSFFKSALRQKETRRSADLGKSNILSKKSSEPSAKSITKNVIEDGSKKATPKSCPEQSSTSKIKEKQPVKNGTPVKQPLLPTNKSKSSHTEMEIKSPVNGKTPLEKSAASKKLSSSMHTTARTTQKFK
ncbi:ubiquitin carboxyl-terminal hydrolase 31 [Protopterus annectens]|uniref:ubiquitin carboxyl-terminal hydrolase 31 n=1 Tax=Protopterus annectens TaxID=7888 RepID=UPI001CFACF97|nr:ubiquitin carboxyl-terminal hydrolase 31 [Protopterus annectens]